MLSVLFVTRKFPPSVGGMETLAGDVAEALEHVCSLRVVALRRSNAYLPLWLVGAVAQVLWHTCVRRDVQRVLLGDAVVNAVLAPLLRLTGTPVTAMVMGLDVTWRAPGYRSLTRATLPLADEVVAISQATAEVACRAGAAKERVSVLRLAVAPPAPLPTNEEARRSLRETLGLAQDARVVVTLGRLVERKGMTWFAREVVPRLEPGTWYVVAGTGPELETLRRISDGQQRSPATLVLGAVDDAQRELLLRGADLFVQPNVPVEGDMEGFGLVTLEATLRGVPVLASGIEGIRDVIDDGETGWLLPPCDVDAWVAAVEDRLSDRSSLRAAAAGFRAEALRRFSLPRMGQDLLETIASAGRNRRPST